MTQEEQAIPQPAVPVTEEAEEEIDNLSDITEVSQEDIVGDKREDLSEVLDVPEPEDTSDLVSVSYEDIYGEKPKQKTQPVKRLKRTSKPYSPPSEMGGIR